VLNIQSEKTYTYTGGDSVGEDKVLEMGNRIQDVENRVNKAWEAIGDILNLLKKYSDENKAAVEEVNNKFPDIILSLKEAVKQEVIDELKR